MRQALLAGLLMVLAGCDFIGGAETLVRGSNNFISADGMPDALGKALSEFENVPRVSDEELLTLYRSIQAKALEGDLDATLVVLRLPAIQRQPEIEEEDQVL